MAIEKEIKWMLSQQSWAALRQAAVDDGSFVKEASQTNHYFDRPDLAMADQMLMLRLRHKNGRWTMTFKAKLERPDEPGMHSVELEAPVTPEYAQSLLSNPAQILDCELAPALRFVQEAGQRAVGLQNLAVIGSMTTSRALITSPSGRWTLELDHSVYADTEDFELECEADDLHAAHDELVGFLERLNIPWTPSKLPKLARLIERLRT